MLEEALFELLLAYDVHPRHIRVLLEIMAVVFLFYFVIHSL